MAEKAQNRKEEILMAAFQAFADKGYDKTSIDEIVNISGLSKGTLYWHFKNKEAIFSEMIRWMTGAIFDPLDALVDQVKTGTLSPTEGIQQMYQITYSFLKQDPRMAHMTADFLLQALHAPGVMQEVLGYYIGFIDRLAEILQQGIDQGAFNPIDTHHAAMAIVTSLDGMSIMATLEGHLEGKYDLEAVFRTAGEVTVRGLMREGKSHDDEHD